MFPYSWIKVSTLLPDNHFGNKIPHGIDTLVVPFVENLKSSKYNKKDFVQALDNEFYFFKKHSYN